MFIDADSKMIDLRLHLKIKTSGLMNSDMQEAGQFLRCFSEGYEHTQLTSINSTNATGKVEQQIQRFMKSMNHLTILLSPNDEGDDGSVYVH